MKKGIVKQIDEIPYGEMTMEGLEAIMDELTKCKPKSNSFQCTEYVSAEQMQELRTGYDAFDRAIMREAGHSEKKILERDIREFIDRNSGMSKDYEVEYTRCKLGYNGMSGEEYFFLNYCKINGRLPLEYTKEKYATYIIAVSRKINYWKKESYKFLDNKFMEQPKSPEQCFRLKNKNLDI